MLVLNSSDHHVHVTLLSWFSDQTKDVTPPVLVLGHPALHKPNFIYLDLLFDFDHHVILIIFWNLWILLYQYVTMYLWPFICDIQLNLWIILFHLRVSSMVPCQPLGRQYISISSNSSHTPVRLSNWQPDTHTRHPTVWSLTWPFANTKDPWAMGCLLYVFWRKILLSWCFTWTYFFYNREINYDNKIANIWKVLLGDNLILHWPICC